MLKCVSKWSLGRIGLYVHVTGYKKTKQYCTLKNTLYSLKQSPRVLFKRLKFIIKNMSYKKVMVIIPYLLNMMKRITILLACADDMIITNDNEDEIARPKRKFSNEFDIKDLEN